MGSGFAAEFMKAALDINTSSQVTYESALKEMGLGATGALSQFIAEASPDQVMGVARFAKSNGRKDLLPALKKRLGDPSLLLTQARESGNATLMHLVHAIELAP